MAVAEPFIFRLGHVPHSVTASFSIRVPRAQPSGLQLLVDPTNGQLVAAAVAAAQASGWLF